MAVVPFVEVDLELAFACTTGEVDLFTGADWSWLLRDGVPELGVPDLTPLDTVCFSVSLLLGPLVPCT